MLSCCLCYYAAHCCFLLWGLWWHMFLRDDHPVATTSLLMVGSRQGFWVLNMGGLAKATHKVNNCHNVLTEKFCCFKCVDFRGCITLLFLNLSLALFASFSTVFWLICTKPPWLAICSRKLPSTACWKFFILWNPVLAHRTVKAPITTWGATEYFSSLGPGLGPNTQFHQWCLLAYSVKSSTPDDLSLLSHSLGEGGSRLSETTCRWLGGDFPITTSYLIDLKSATATGILWTEGAVTWKWTNREETKAVRDWLGSSHIIGTKIHL